LSLSRKETVEDLPTLLGDAVAYLLVGEVGLGSFLRGSLDPGRAGGARRQGTVWTLVHLTLQYL